MRNSVGGKPRSTAMSVASDMTSKTTPPPQSALLQNSSCTVSESRMIALVRTKSSLFFFFLSWEVGRWLQKYLAKKNCNFTRTETSKIPLQCSASNMDHEIVAAIMERAYKRYAGCRLYPEVFNRRVETAGYQRIWKLWWDVRLWQSQMSI